MPLRAPGPRKQEVSLRSRRRKRLGASSSIRSGGAPQRAPPEAMPSGLLEGAVSEKERRAVGPQNSLRLLAVGVLELPLPFECG